jgi:ATP-binding cassette subfamily F protein 3
MIDFNNIYKSYPSQDILINATFRINKGERVGLVGPNGAGKSTVFALIIGELHPDKGTVSMPSNTRVGYLRQHLNTNKDELLLDFTANAIPEIGKLHDQIELLESQIGGDDKEKKLKQLGELQSRFEALEGYEIRTKSEAILSGLGFHESEFNNPLSSFSGGWQMRAGLAKVLVSNPEIMLLDEPSNYLDMPAIEWLQRYLKTFKGTLALISHDRYLLKSLTNVTIEINSGIVTRYPGNYDFYEREREHRLKSLSSAKKNQDKKREQMERFVERFKSKNTKASQAQSKLKMLEKMEDIIIPDSLSYSGTITIPPPPHSGSEIMRLENISFTYKNDGEFSLKDISLRIERNQKIAITGYNGTGKTTLLKLIAGVMEPCSGKRVTGHKVVIGYQAQEFGDILPSDQTVFDIVRNAAAEGLETKRIRGALGAFGFSGDAVDKPCKVLSGGEKIRLCFARIFVNPPNFLILDEPTTHLDLHAREALQDALKKYSGTLCLVSHDIEFVRNTAEMIIEMNSPGITRFHGNYDYFLTKKASEQKEEVFSDSENIPKNLKKARRQERAAQRNKMKNETRKHEKQIEKIEAKIEKLDSEKKTIIEKIENKEPNLDFYAVNKRLVEIEEDVEVLTVKWENETLKLEEIIEKYDEII